MQHRDTSSPADPTLPEVGGSYSRLKHLRSPIVDGDSEPEQEPFSIGPILKAYLPLGLGLVVLGSLAGLGTVLLEAPLYKAGLVIEINPISENYIRNSSDPLAANYDSSSINLETQLRLLTLGPFIGRVHDRLLAAPPPAPLKPDLFAHLRNRLLPQSPIPENVRAVLTAASTFDVRPINGTRLLELSCESTHPAIAASFLNAVAEDFVDDSTRNLSEGSERASDWLGKQFQETKVKLEEAEGKLRDFEKRSGNVFVGSDNASTIDDVKLRQLQGELAAAQADRISKQARYESTQRGSPPEETVEFAKDAPAGLLRDKLLEVRRQKDLRSRAYTPKDSQMKALSDQEQELSKSLAEQAQIVVNRLRNEYEDATRHERLLNDAYTALAGQVSSQAGKAAAYLTMKREIDSLRQTYDQLLQRINQNGPASALPIAPMRLVQASQPPDRPYAPNPATNISLGGLAGVLATVVFAFVRTKMDRSVRMPGSTRILLNVPELGVIPAASKLSHSPRLSRAARQRSSQKLLSIQSSTDGNPSTAGQALELIAPDGRGLLHAAWGREQRTPILADRFRATLASLVREAGSSRACKVIMISSPCEGDGKTTITANLGIAMAEAGRRVLLVDADMRRPRLGKLFNISDRNGLAEILQDRIRAQDAPIESLAARTGIPGLWILTAGSLPGNVTQLFYSQQLAIFINQARQEFDAVLFDVPPLLLLADARIVARCVDGAVLVVRAGQTDRASVIQANQCLVEDGVQLYGTVLNDWDPRASSSYFKFYDYGSTR